ncbi:MAG: hypothetical protein WC445_02105 [Patescibacteria group bacterium]
MSRIEYSQLITDSGNGKSISKSFVFDLPEKEEAALDKPETAAPRRASGQIFGMIEIEAPSSKKSLSFLDVLISEIKEAAAGSFGKPGQKTPEEIFENFIQKTNYRYLELVSNKSSAAFLDEETDGLPKINAILSFLDEKNLHLAGRGKMLPFLIYEVKQGNFRIMDITETATGKEARSSKLSLFTNIVSGKIGANDYLFFTTESILDYFSLEKICKTVSAATPEAAKETLKNLLGETANPGTSFAFMVIKLRTELPVIKATLSPAPAASSDNRETTSPQNSMDGLLKTAADTEKMLTPSLGLNIGGGFFSFLGGLKNIFRKNEIKSNARLEYYSSQFHPPTSINKFFRSISLILLAILRIPYFLIRIIFSFLFNLLKIIFYSITNWKGQRKTAFANAAESFQKSWSAILPKTEKLPKLSKTLLVFAVICVTLFVGSTAFLYFKYQKDVATKALQEKVEVVQNKKSSAEASLIYNDETGARTVLTEIDALLSAFPQKTKDEKKAYQNLLAETEKLREKLRHVEKIENPVAVANFPSFNPDAAVENFIVTNNNIYAFDRSASVIYKINLQNNEVANKSVSGLNFQIVFMEKDDSAFLYESGEKFFKLDLKEDILKELEVVMASNETEIQDLAVYNQKLYVLDPRDGQIFKHLATPTGFGGGTNWLRETVDISKAKSLAIDGAIYLGTTDGKILEFANGQQTEFSVEVDPTLSSEIKIWTSTESSFLYVLEPQAKRLIVLDKQGKLIIQYFSEKFDNLKNLAVREKEKKIYLLSGDFVYEITATHLQ